MDLKNNLYTSSCFSVFFGYTSLTFSGVFCILINPVNDLFQPCYEYMEPAVARKAGMYPYFHPLEGSEGPVVWYKGRRVIMLGSNNYLGLTHHPEVIQAAKEAIDRYGTGCTGSRFLNGNLTLHAELEEELARFFQKESALVFTTGFLANAGVIQILGSHPDAVIISQRENHASLIEGARLARGKKYIFENAEDLENLLKKRESWENALVVTDAVFSMTGRVMDLRKLVELKKRYRFKLYVDDAHGIGVLGPQGRGTTFEQGVQEEVDLLFGTFSKSLASVGGFVAGPSLVIDYLRHKTRTLIFTAGLPPASVAAALAALWVMEKEESLFRRLWENVRYFKEGVEKIGFYTMGSTTPIIPLFIGSESLACKISVELLEMGVFTTPVLYPAVPYGQALIRTSVTPAHSFQHLDEALKALKTIWERYPIPRVDGDSLPEKKEMDLSYFFSALT